MRAILFACLSTLCACANYKYQDIGNHSFKQRAMQQIPWPYYGDNVVAMQAVLGA